MIDRWGTERHKLRPDQIKENWDRNDKEMLSEWVKTLENLDKNNPEHLKELLSEKLSDDTREELAEGWFVPDAI